MHAPGSRIRLRRNVRLSAPEGRWFNGWSVQWVEISVIQYPGEQYPPETTEASAPGDSVHWAFWTSYDADSAFVFSSADVAELELAPEIELIAAFTPAPFAITKMQALKAVEVHGEVKYEEIHR